MTSKNDVYQHTVYAFDWPVWQMIINVNANDIEIETS